MANITGTSGNDTIRLSGASSTSGKKTTSLPNATNQDDLIDGRAGNDWIEAAGGNDTLIGGDGRDTASYSYTSQSVSVTLNDSGDSTATVGTSGTDIDTLRTIENVTGSSGADTLRGNSAANVLNGARGNDTINGGNG